MYISVYGKNSLHIGSLSNKTNDTLNKIVLEYPDLYEKKHILSVILNNLLLKESLIKLYKFVAIDAYNYKSLLHMIWNFIQLYMDSFKNNTSSLYDFIDIQNSVDDIFLSYILQTKTELHKELSDIKSNIRISLNSYVRILKNKMNLVNPYPLPTRI